MIVYSNSDSFGVVSNGKVYADFIAEHFGAKLIQKGLSGSCNQRIIRTTVRDLIDLDTTEPILVLISISNIYRTEYWSASGQDNDGHFKSIRVWQTEKDKQDPVIAEYLKQYSLLHNDEAEMTNLYCSLVMLTSFLKSKGYRYLIWNGPSTYKPVDFSAPFISPFAEELNRDLNIIPFDKFSFCKYNVDKGHVPIDYNLYKEHGHHGEAAHQDFANYLIENYLNEI